MSILLYQVSISTTWVLMTKGNLYKVPDYGTTCSHMLAAKFKNSPTNLIIQYNFSLNHSHPQTQRRPHQEVRVAQQQNIEDDAKKTFLGFEPRIPPLFSLSTVSSTTPQQAAAACVIRPPFFREPPLTSPLPNSTLTTGQRTGQFPPFIPLCREHLPDRFVLDDTGFHLHRRRGDLRNRPARNRALVPCKWPTFVALFSPLFDLFSSLPPSFSCVLFRSTTRHDTVTRRPYADCSADPINLAGW